ncbi:hypothetical protein [Rhizobium sp. SSA_523]|uniref:hypothetical protein n=1 Tax=Rhizobium sp. SSA_523 TaxID=2952477 RepID=UPI002090A59B|nr:hypothetical protein [Rhizobium sp. SSA_523]MCO5733187.1 hypothetical protein [Rhizobium sp. SSA_523]WKC24057.1 hypothetical protein QTJ18_25410 [Rhizobium sp. SSA_523]
MKTMQGIRAGLGICVVTAVAAGVSGCVSSPTYGTSKTAGEQLVDDLGQSLAFSQDAANKDTRYNPRPKLVVSKSAESSLPPPQASLAGRDNNPNWVESPEETRARLRLEAEENRNNPNYRSPLLAGNGTAGTMTETQRWEAFRKARANAESPGISGQRRTLTEPPTQYRLADNAALTDLGEPELKKERERKKSAASAASNTSSWWNPFK